MAAPLICDGTGHLPRQSGGKVNGGLLGLCPSCQTFQYMVYTLESRWVLGRHEPEQEHEYSRTGAPL